MKDGRPFAFAGLWKGWKPPEGEDWIRMCAIITGEPNELIIDPRDSHPDAGDPARQPVRRLAIRRSRERDSGPVSSGRNDGLADQSAGEQSEE
jgi:hypothetical protein